MLNFINSLMLMKKIYVMALLALGCGNDNNFPKPVEPEEPEQPKQYGVPFASVPDPQNIVLYEVNIRAFSEQGNLQGVIDRLDHIKSLGFNAIWLMPIHPVGQERSAGGLGSPYAVKNYLEVNPEFGDLQKMRDLVQNAHDRNMAVIIDWVANHTSWDNPWLENKTWYSQDANGNVIIPPGTNWNDVAELNYDNHDMRDAMIHAMKYWVMEANVDGFRCDAVDYVPSDFWKQAIDELKALPNRKLILLAEGGKQENFAAGFQMNYAWDFVNNLEQVYKENKSATSIFTTHEAEYSKIPAGAIKLRYTTNHDLSAWEETPIEAFGGKSAALSASVVTIFTSASPLIYSGQEVGREEKLPFFTREPINWNENHDMLDSYDKLFSVYHQSKAFTQGQLTYFPNDDVAAFSRKFENDEYLILVNTRSSEEQFVPHQAIKDSKWINAYDSTVYEFDNAITLSPYSFYILKKQ